MLYEIVKSSPKSTRGLFFKDIHQGDIFKNDFGALFIKTEDAIANGGHNCNSVNLLTGGFVNFESQDRIHSVFIGIAEFNTNAFTSWFEDYDNYYSSRTKAKGDSI